MKQIIQENIRLGQKVRILEDQLRRYECREQQLLQEREKTRAMLGLLMQDLGAMVRGMNWGG